MAVMTRPKPHEGVRGEDRPGDPILESTEVSAIVGRLTKRLWSATVIGAARGVPVSQAAFERMQHPRDGDLVVVTDAFWRNDPDDHYKGVGYLIGIREEQEGDLTEPEAVYIQYGPTAGHICRWVNCTVISATE